MSRVFTSIVFASLAAGGCVADQGDESFVIQSILSPPADECLFQANAAGPFLSHGRVDFFASEYGVGAQFQSRVVAAEGKESLRTIQIQGANISLAVGDMQLIDQGGTTNAGGAQTIELQTVFSSALAPNSGLSTAFFDVIPPDVMATLRATAGAAATDLMANTSGQVVPPQIALVDVVATITAFGDFYGDRIDSTSFQFPITVTNDDRTILRDCPLPETFTLPDMTNGCSNFSDTTVACCFDRANGKAVCPPPVAVCGDGVCSTNAAEDNMSCPADCP
jgi:hypothetical protein